MLDDINSELISIYPGTFPNPRPFSRKPLVFNSGFHAYIRPPLPLYRIQCNNDYIAEKSKRAEAAIRKLYKAAATTSTATFKEVNTLFQHDLSPEAMLTKYRDTQIYSKSRLRKVNRRQLMRALSLARKRDDDDSKKQYDVSISKVDLHPTSSRPKLKNKIFGALKLEPWKNKNRSSSATEDVEKRSKSESEMVVSKPSTHPKSESKARVENEQSKPKGLLTLKKPMMVKKSGERAQARKSEASKDLLHSNAELLKEEEEEGEGRRPLKEGNYTKIVTFKRKTLFKSSTSVEISNFPFTDQLTGKYGGSLQKVVQKEGGNNEIDHLYKINELEASLKAITGVKPINVVSAKKTTLSESKLEVVDCKAEESQTKDSFSAAKRTEKEEIKRTELLRKYGVNQTLTTAPHGLQPKEIPNRLSRQAIAEVNEIKSEIRFKQRKPKKEENILFLPKVTPTLGVDPPKLVNERKNTLRLRLMPSGTKSEVTFVNFR